MGVSAVNGTLVRVSLTATVRSRTDWGYAPPNINVTPVSGDSGDHFLNLDSTLVTGVKTLGGEVTAVFDGIVTGKPGNLATTSVREVLPDGSAGLEHYIFLGSSAAQPRTDVKLTDVKLAVKGTTAMSLTLSDLKGGDKVSVAPFEAEIVDLDGTSSCVKVRDDDGNVSLVFLNRLTKIAPYRDGAVYLSLGNVYYRYAAGAAGANGTWQPVNIDGGKFTNRAGTPEKYDYPGRPLREVTLSEPVAE